MKNDKLITEAKKIVLKRILKDGREEKRVIGQNKSNSKELTLKSVELYEPFSYEQLLNMNKKKYRNLKIKRLINHLTNAIKEIYYAIDIYKELKDRTEYWEEKETFDFNFSDWNKIKKVNGKLTGYYKDLISIRNKIERG